jgi:surface protein
VFADNLSLFFGCTVLTSIDAGVSSFDNSSFDVEPDEEDDDEEGEWQKEEEEEDGDAGSEECVFQLSISTWIDCDLF